MNISNRARQTPPSPIRKLVPFADQAKSKGVKVYHLNIGQPDIKSPPLFLKALRKFPNKTVAYENSLGNPQLRQGLADYYKKCKIKVSAENIIVTTGASEAILFALLAICDPDDQCLVPEPFYANYLGFASMTDVKLKALQTLPENGFHLPNKKIIESKINKKTRAIIICNPNNPTGTVYSKTELQIIVTIAKKHNLFIISDETYREFVYDNTTHHSFLSLSEKPKNVILIDSFSKRYSLCGARLGFLATYLKKINHEYQKRRDVLIKGLQTTPGVFVQKPQGAFYMIVKLPVKNAEHFAKWLLTDFRYHNQTVMLAPASGFYLTKNAGINEVRIAYVLNTKNLKQSTIILKKALQVYTK